MDRLLALAVKGDATAAKNARATFDAALNLIDPEWGDIHQCSDNINWRSPHYEKIMSYQSSGLRQFSLAYALQFQVTRFANLLNRYSGDTTFRTLAGHGMKYLASKDLLDSERPLPGTLLADSELSADPLHLTIAGSRPFQLFFESLKRSKYLFWRASIGKTAAHFSLKRSKDSAGAQALHRAARAVPVSYKRVDWWDRREGVLKNPGMTYPELDQAAAFLCTNRVCSLPAFTPEELGAAPARVVKIPGSGFSAGK